MAEPAEDAPEPGDSDALAYSAAADIKAVRDFVGARAVALGLRAPRVNLLILAVSELATNTLQHTSGGGRVRVWAQAHQLVCDVIDHGQVHSFGRRMPAADALRGRGLAIVERVCDAVEASAVPGGVRTRIWMNL